MPDLRGMDSQDPLLDDFKEDVIESGHDEQLDNRKRGCGHLQHNSLYVRSDVQALSTPEGEIPRFIELDDPVEYREYGDRGAILPGYTEFPGVEFGWAYRNDGGTTTPAGEIEAHVERLRNDLLDGEHYGEMVVPKATDLLMSVGKTHWPTPEEYIAETKEMGLNLKVPAGPNGEPPVVNPFRTRCWVIHPNGLGPSRAAIIGYAVLTRTIFTTGEGVTASDPDVPQYAQEWHDAGKVDLATPGPEEPDALDPQTGVGEFVEEGDGELPEFEGVIASDNAEEAVEEAEEPAHEVAEGADTVVPSDKDGHDVEPAEAAKEAVTQVAEEADETEEGGVFENPLSYAAPVLVTEGSDHIRDPEKGPDETLCGRVVDVEAKGGVEGTSEYASDYDACGTCLSAVKARTEGDDDDS